MRRYIFSLLFVIIGLGAVFSQEKPRIALLPLNPMGVSEKEAADASDLFRAAIVRADQFIIIEQNQVNEIILTQSFTLTGNTDETYAKEIGKLLPAEQIIIGSFSHVGTEFILSSKIIDIESGQSKKSEKISFLDPDDLSDSIDLLVKKLLEQDFSISEISNTDSDNFSEYIYQISLGSAYSFYFQDVQTVINSMDEGSLSRIPFSMDLLFGKKMSDSTAWTVSLNSGIDSFTDSSDSFYLYTVLLSVGFQYIPFQKGLTLGVEAGGSILFPNTTLDYVGDIELGSSISIDIGYFFEKLKFTNADIIPGLGIKYIHSEMFRGSVDQISGYINLGIR
ncbi:MAG: hypothetical protein KAQ93_04055 [Spirochaetales bacterium]|nr:hypothetical protein [Spirochaetales bacterium]